MRKPKDILADVEVVDVLRTDTKYRFSLQSKKNEMVSATLNLTAQRLHQFYEEWRLQIVQFLLVERRPFYLTELGSFIPRPRFVPKTTSLKEILVNDPLHRFFISGSMNQLKVAFNKKQGVGQSLAVFRPLVQQTASEKELELAALMQLFQEAKEGDEDDHDHEHLTVHIHKPVCSETAAEAIELAEGGWTTLGNDKNPAVVHTSTAAAKILSMLKGNLESSPPKSNWKASNELEVRMSGKAKGSGEGRNGDTGGPLNVQVGGGEGQGTGRGSIGQGQGQGKGSIVQGQGRGKGTIVQGRNIGQGQGKGSSGQGQGNIGQGKGKGSMGHREGKGTMGQGQGQGQGSVVQGQGQGKRNGTNGQEPGQGTIGQGKAGGAGSEYAGAAQSPAAGRSGLLHAKDFQGKESSNSASSPSAKIGSLGVLPLDEFVDSRNDEYSPSFTYRGREHEKDYRANCNQGNVREMPIFHDHDRARMNGGVEIGDVREGIADLWSTNSWDPSQLLHSKLAGEDNALYELRYGSSAYEGLLPKGMLADGAWTPNSAAYNFLDSSGQYPATTSSSSSMVLQLDEHDLRSEARGDLALDGQGLLTPPPPHYSPMVAPFPSSHDPLFGVSLSQIPSPPLLPAVEVEERLSPDGIWLSDWLPVVLHGFPAPLVQSLCEGLREDGLISVSDLLIAQSMNQLSFEYLRTLGFKVGHFNRIVANLQKFTKK